MKKKYKNALKIGVGAAALGASNYLGKRAGEQDIAKKILASYTGDTDTVLKKTSAFGIAKPTARNKGGQIKPIKAVLGLGIVASKKGRDTLKKFLKGKKEIASSAPGMAAVPTTMNKGGGMDMGHKPRPRGNPGIVENVVGKGGDYIKDLID